MGVITRTAADAILTSMWVFSVSTLGVLTSVVSSLLGVEGPAVLLITTALLFVLLFIFTTLGVALGGATFNPTATISFYAAGIGEDDLFSMAFRFPAQAVGGVAGALAIIEVIPVQYKHLLSGPSLKVDVHTGAIAEGILTFMISFAVLVIVLKGPRNSLLKLWFLAMITVSLVVVGSGYTGPAMNPANAFGWAYVKNSHDKWEQLYVYWILPMTGAVLAGWTFRSLFPAPTKQKKV